MNEPLCGTNLSGELLEEAFVAAGRTTRGSLEKASAEKIDHPGGYTSDIYRVFLNWKEQGKGEALPSRVLVKIPKQEHIDNITKMFDRKTAGEYKKAVNIDIFTQVEHNVYRMLPKEAPHIPIPKCYSVWIKGKNSLMLIAMEDLSPRASIPDLALGLTGGQLINCAEAIATLQAWSLNTQYEWKKEVPDMEKYMNSFLPVLCSGVSQVESSVRKHSAYLNCVDVEKTCSILRNKEQFIAAMTEYRTLVPDVFVHGDFWGNNILFQLEGEKSSIGDRIAAIIDWQACHQGSFVEDLCRLYSFSVNPDIRRSTMKDVFRHYFNKLLILAPAVMSSVTLEKAYGVFEKTLSLYGLLLIAFAPQLSQLLLRDHPTREAALMTRIAENYKEAAKYFGF